MKPGAAVTLPTQQVRRQGGPGGLRQPISSPHCENVQRRAAKKSEKNEAELTSLKAGRLVLNHTHHTTRAKP